MLKRTLSAPAIILCGLGIFGLAGCGGSNQQQTSGTIVFGSAFHRVSAYQLIVVKPHSTFHDGQWMGWVAQLEHKLKATSVTITVLQTKTGHVIQQETQSALNPTFIQLAQHIPVDTFVKLGGTVPGEFTVQYSTGNQVLARGTFKITR